MRRYSLPLAFFLLAGSVSVTALAMQPGVQSAQAGAAASSDVQAALKTPIDSRHAKVGQEVTAVTRGDADLGGTRLPKGTTLVGHVTDVAAKGGSNANGSVSMVFDQARLKNGNSVPVHAVLRGIAPAADMQASASDDMMTPAGAASTSGGASVRGGGLLGGAAGATRGTLGTVTGTAGSVTGAAVNTVGKTAHTVAGTAAQGLSSVPGISLTAGADAATSGTLTGAGQNVHLDSGTQLTLGLAAR